MNGGPPAPSTLPNVFSFPSSLPANSSGSSSMSTSPLGSLPLQFSCQPVFQSSQQAAQYQAYTNALLQQALAHAQVQAQVQAAGNAAATNLALLAAQQRYLQLQLLGNGNLQLTSPFAGQMQNSSLSQTQRTGQQVFSPSLGVSGQLSNSSSRPSFGSSTVSSSSSSARSSVFPVPDYRSVIECGCVDLKKGHRVMSMFSDYFGKEMEIYTADNDPQVRVLFRASTLAEKFDCATNKVGMYLQRRRQADAGIFQAISFRGKPSGKTGLKVGAYFLSLQACTDFETHFHQQSMKRERGLQSIEREDGKAIEEDEGMEENIEIDGEGEEVSTSVSSSGGSRLNSLHTTDVHSHSSSHSSMTQRKSGVHSGHHSSSHN
jgi:hypothetical protein